MPGDPEWPAVIPLPEETGEYMSPDPSKTTRIDFTDFFQRFQPAEDAHPLYKQLFLIQQQLAKLCIEHPAMKPNLRQTFSTPANSKNKVYFMWDFILRTFQQLVAEVNPQNPQRSPMFDDIIGRASMAQSLINDDSGQLETMNRNTGYNDDRGVEFTPEIKALAMKLLSVPDACAGCFKKSREDGKPLLLCSKCKQAQYCSPECQKKCWKTHKKTCGKTVTEDVD